MILIFLIFTSLLCAQVNIGAGVSIGGAPVPGVFNVRTMYGAKPDGTTDNSTAITNAFAASNNFTSGTPTVYFDCDTRTTVCVYNYGGSGTSPINPTVATTVLCAPGTTLNYTGSAHAADIGASGLSVTYQNRYTIQGCRWTGGASYTAGIYFNAFATNPAVLFNEFSNFGNRTGYTLVFNGGDWTPLIEGNSWHDNDGASRNMIDAHSGGNLDLTIIGNKTECETSLGAACSVSTVGVGIWANVAFIVDNELKYHQPIIRLSSCCGANSGMHIAHNIFEGNTGQLGPAISFGDPGGTGNIHLVGPTVEDNFLYWPVASGVPDIGPETPASGSYFLDALALQNNTFAGNAPSGGAVWVNTNQGVGTYVANNRTTGGTVLNQASSPAIIDGTFASIKAFYAVQSSQGSGGSLANSIPVFDSNAVNLNRASYHSMAGPLLCSDSTGSGTTQTCSTSPAADFAGTSIAPTAGDQIIYKTTTTNTGDLTINVNGTGAVHVRKYVAGSLVVLVGGDLQAGAYVPLVYDGTYWQDKTINQ